MRAWVVAVGAASIVSAGCGGIHYTIALSSASSRIEEARVLGAEQFAPYEYYFAKEHIEQARIEASEASYSDAVTLAQEAEAHASAAVELTQKAKRAQ
jgi:hypothetical protein